MFAPKLYTVLKFELKDIVEADYNLELSGQELKKFQIKQQDNMLFRQLRKITGQTGAYNPFVFFVNAAGGQTHKDEIREMVFNGIMLNGRHFVVSERSASMTRTGILSFLDEAVAKEIDRRITMDISFEKIVLSKYCAYRGLFYSSCHMLEDWIPKVIVVPDYEKMIPNQRIKYVYDDTTTFIDSEGREREWTQKAIAEGVRDIKSNVFDGCGLIHPSLCREIEERIGSKTPVTSFIIRAPYIKGLLVEMDYTEFFLSRDVEYIQDCWGTWHDVRQPMMILTESQYKGKSYFKTYGDARDWDLYWDRFQKYEHCIGVAKWNFTFDEEPVYTRANYQILQDLELPYDQFRNLANDSVMWADKIINGDPLYTYCFLGMYADKAKPKNDYIKAALKNPEMLREPTVRKYLINLLAKYRDEMKAGKLWIKGTFKFWLPDLIMMMEYIAGLEPVGCLGEDEFYANSKHGRYEGEYLIERNPHICKSEHVILKAKNSEILDKYFGNLSNICMVNGYGITPARLNGSDHDGDIVFVIENDIMMAGVDRNAPIVIDVEDKITALAEEDTLENRYALIMRTMNSLIGETSNCSTGYHNKCPRSDETKKKYEEYVDLLSVINGKAIDYAKTGVLFNIPRHIAKYSKPLPYFMKYAGDYYKNMNTFNESQSNMNRLCKDLEHWTKATSWKRNKLGFDYTIMLNPEIEIPQEIFDRIDSVYQHYCKEMAQLVKDQNDIRKNGANGLTAFEARNFLINWDFYYSKYRDLCHHICPNKEMLANIAVKLCFEKYPNKSNKKFIWIVAGSGVINNLEQKEFELPIRDEDGDYEYLGRRYSMELYSGEDNVID